jgi:hypothetical protein
MQGFPRIFENWKKHEKPNMGIVMIILILPKFFIQFIVKTLKIKFFDKNC